MMANKDHKEFIHYFKKQSSIIVTLNIPNQINFIDKEKLKKIVNRAVFLQKQKFY